MKHREFIALLGGVERIGVRLTTHAARNAKPLIRTSRSDTSSTLRPGIRMRTFMSALQRPHSGAWASRRDLGFCSGVTYVP